MSIRTRSFERWEKLLVIHRIREGAGRAEISKGFPDYDDELCFLCNNPVGHTCMRIASYFLCNPREDIRFFYAHNDCFRRIYDGENSPYEIPYSTPENLDEKAKR